MYKKLVTSFLCFAALCCSAQDPKFSQYFASPLTLNPAYTGFFDGEYRIAVNTRQQWGNVGDAYNTYSISGDVKLVADENFTNHVFSIGLSGLFDESFNKALKTQYISASFSYYQYLDVAHKFKFGLAPQVSYASRYLDHNALTFASQYTSNGSFNSALPNHLDLNSHKASYFDVNIGANFSGTFDRWSIALGFAHYHLARPKQSLLTNSFEVVAPRSTIHIGALHQINRFTDLNFTGIYNAQKKNNDILFGAVLGLMPNEETKFKLNLGMWYQVNQSSFYPYLGINIGDFSAGINYTLYGNKVIDSTPRTYELSLIYRHNNFKGFKVPCPRF